MSFPVNCGSPFAAAASTDVLCIGDEVPEATRQVVSIDDEVSDVFGATSRRPFAYWIPGGEVEVGVPASFFVELAAGEFAGNLLGRSANIRFEPIAARWQFSDGETGSGFSVERIFDAPGSLSAGFLILMLKTVKK